MVADVDHGPVMVAGRSSRNMVHLVHNCRIDDSWLDMFSTIEAAHENRRVLLPVDGGLVDLFHAWR